MGRNQPLSFKFMSQSEPSSTWKSASAKSDVLYQEVGQTDWAERNRFVQIGHCGRGEGYVQDQCVDPTYNRAERWADGRFTKGEKARGLDRELEARGLVRNTEEKAEFRAWRKSIVEDKISRRNWYKMEKNMTPDQKAAFDRFMEFSGQL